MKLAVHKSQQKNEVSKIFIIFMGSKKGGDFSSNKLLNLVGYTEKYSSLNEK